MDQFGVLGDFSGRISTEKRYCTIGQPSIRPTELSVVNCCAYCQMVVTDSLGRILVLDNGSDPIDGKTFFTLCGYSFPDEKVLHDVNNLTLNQKLFPLVPEGIMKLTHCYKKISLA